MTNLLPQIKSPADMQKLSDEQLQTLCHEIRDELIRVLTNRPAHFASNLGVVELCLALHLSFDFSKDKDRLIWDTGHQIYPQKLITGRYEQFHTIRTKGGLMGFPHPGESEYDLFMTGHAGCSVSTASGLKAGDELMGRKDNHAVAVIGDGAFPSGIVFEALNNIGGMKQNTLVILNDNKMSICPRTGGLAQYFDQCRMTGLYQGSKRKLNQLLNNIPVIGGMAHSALEQFRDGLKAFFKDGMLFEELGFRYFGPVDGHDLPGLRKILRDLKSQEGPILLHVFTNKGHGVPQAAEDPVTYHTPPVFEQVGPNRAIVSFKKGGAKGYTDAISFALHQAMQDDPTIAVMTAAMCQGNKLEKVREDFPQRFYDVGICESHAVAFAAGMAKAGANAVVDIYSTFLQRSFDQIFQEVCLQNLHVTFLMDRAGLTGPDGPTHHGVFDVPYMRLFPNMVSMAPGDETDVQPMLKFALKHTGPISVRYPKANLEKVERTEAPTPIELGKAEVIDWGEDGCFVAFGTLLSNCTAAAKKLKAKGIHMGVINARFVKPLDKETILRAVETLPLVVTVEEGTIEGGFGSAVLEAANAAGLDARNVVRRGIPDKFIEHGERNELLADIGLSVDALVELVLTSRSAEVAKCG
ncbi:1-deoxy-d-xylulose-5-phosphate synthase : 1-deoxy-D-xylulose-5-phosphate synthase OS=Singulisphaera acidiphila (strain ATCC BAA-1392 / DSM 18658 / VKM B-2454 / MOB10) GN=dxs PE=3 SV=1: DXP_synthase_N: Transket_pyr: Transketolase_C [Gemmata massiliana]|uniref:1-deoxy-D-xylulose-5-phosphate synthase n=1 Tax=Gemmata massiliana TaxID=1210884 RepID=A0A6P2CVH4_9BACT|nr:1-deoxy-D-xylulose-5-phosphate synthase [Gemmata massiliana]VTR91102.1 1-deoxy-d-xylulose-5-phosphate synthase : 1-deoxy-D-xylulose-5-phosphate synthase OS=Singulisphaera acidiphila (strain ATCC BAA-1392 / DSM 18658 / VKM B-2454 / MOB10) GN=dxs PE=3 SV=1: DXP_synthase_N: Transket_pyr: Transketolase_C [Gemmata massiliana]